MTALLNIWGVARYERKMLLRTTKFRILGGIGVLIPVLIGGGFALAEARGIEFQYSGLGAYMPFYVYTFLQTIVIAFIVGDFRAGDERAHVFEVVAARPISTAELVAGKYLGVVGALFSLSIGVLVLTLAIQAAKISITGTPFNIRPYLGYLVLMNLPGLIFMSAVTFFLGALLRRQTAVALVVIAYAMAVLFFLGRRYGGLYDFGAFFAPLYYSDLIGLGDMGRTVALRLFYLALALAFFGLSIDRYPRLTQSVAWRWFGRGTALVGVGVAAGLYLGLEAREDQQAAFRAEQLAAQTALADRPVAQVLHCVLDVSLMAEHPIEARAQLTLRNPHASVLDTLILTLNPGLDITALQLDGRDAPYKRLGTVVVVLPSRPLSAEGETVLDIHYAGAIDTDGFDLLREQGQPRLRKRDGPINKGSMTAWVRHNSVLLPPRSRWYPAVGVDYGHTDTRPQSFFTSEITLNFAKGLHAVTQGVPAPADTARRRVTQTWRSDKPVPVLSLNAGEYAVFEARVHGVDCALYIHPSHRRQVDFFEDVQEEVTTALDQIIDAMEQETGIGYPYARLSVVEVPFHVQWYYEGWEETGGLVQPGVLMVEEDTVLRQRFRRNFKQFQKRSQGDRDPKQIKKDLFTRAIFDTFFGTSIYRSPAVQLWAFDKTFGGDHYALLKAGMPMYLQEDLRTNLQSSLFSRGGGRRGRGGFRRPRSSGSNARWDTLVAKMAQRSFDQLDPNAEPELYRDVVAAKGPALFKMLEAYVGEDAFRQVLEDVEAEYKYAQIDFSAFEKAAVGDTTGDVSRRNLQRLVKDWIHGTQVPGYTLTKAVANKVDDGFGMVVYQLVVRIRNGEAGRGFVQITAMGRSDEAAKGVEIEGGQEVEVAMILWERPFRVMVEPFFARNRRPLMSPVRVPDQVMAGFPESYVREVPPDETTSIEIVVDNEDEGFAMPVRRDRRFLRPELKGGNWRERTVPMAFGRYETSYRYKSPGDGAQPAVWSAKLPKGGEYDVAYYYIDNRFASRLGLASTFHLVVSHSGQSDTLKIERGQLKAGWNTLGRYRFFENEHASIELSDLANGRLYADAVRWRFVDPDNPNAVFEDDMPTWEMFGRRGGRQPGGRGGASGRSPGGRRDGGMGF